MTVIIKKAFMVSLCRLCRVTVLGLCSQVSFAGSFQADFVSAAVDRTRHTVRYDGSYIPIDYPNGDVPAYIGVCTDVVIRSYRAVGVDLQKMVHEDMLANFERYPSRRIWGHRTPDHNIDHRRVLNLQVFFARHGEVLPVSNRKEDYSPGDIVTWMLAADLPHIGIVSDRVSSDSGNPLIVHNIGAGPKLEDMLFNYEITGHYRYAPGEYEN